MNQENLNKLAEHLIHIKNEIEQALEIINLKPNKNLDNLNLANTELSEYFEDDSKIIEGIFNGEVMMGPDGKQYSVPANYISKSKIVEGDKLKLTIKKDGTFVYKQIEQTTRTRTTGVLTKDETSKNFMVLVDGKLFKVQKAAVTYFKGEIGDKATVLVPENKNSTWAAIENILKDQESGNSTQESGDSKSQEPRTRGQESEELEISNSENQTLNANENKEITPISLEELE